MASENQSNQFELWNAVSKKLTTRLVVVEICSSMVKTSVLIDELSNREWVTPTVDHPQEDYIRIVIIDVDDLKLFSVNSDNNSYHHITALIVTDDLLSITPSWISSAFDTVIRVKPDSVTEVAITLVKFINGLSSGLIGIDSADVLCFLQNSNQGVAIISDGDTFKASCNNALAQLDKATLKNCFHAFITCTETPTIMINQLDHLGELMTNLLPQEPDFGFMVLGVSEENHRSENEIMVILTT